MEADAQIEVPRGVGGSIKALAHDPQYRAAWRFIVDQLCGQRRLSFIPNAPVPTEFMIWREGRRFVGEMLQRIADAPMVDEVPPEPPARTMTERVRRRGVRTKSGKG